MNRSFKLFECVLNEYQTQKTKNCQNLKEWCTIYIYIYIYIYTYIFFLLLSCFVYVLLFYIISKHFNTFYPLH